MPDEDKACQEEARGRTLGAILAFANAAALIFGLCMVMWVYAELGHEGEGWGFIGVFIFGVPGLLLIVPLWMGTLAWVIAKRRLCPLAARLVLMALATCAVAADAFALFRVWAEIDCPGVFFPTS